MTDHPTTEAHTCHDHCPCQPEPEFKLGKPYIIPADARNRFMQYANEALEMAMRDTWTRLENVLTVFPVESETPSSPAPDLARDGDAQSLWWQVWHAMNRHPKVCGKVSEERLDDCTDAALSVVQPELQRRDDLASELRKQVQSRTKAMDELFRTREKARKEASKARSELADMTAQREASDVHADRLLDERDRIRGERDDAEQAWRDAVERGAASARRAESVEQSAALYLKERDQALTERDDAIRSTDAVAAERDAEAYERDRERVGREAAEADADRLGKSLRNELNRNGDLRAERDHLTGLLADVRETRDALAEQRNRRERERDTAQAEVKELREELEHWTSGRRRKGLPRVESVPDAVARAAEMVRSSYEGDLPDDIADVMRGNAHRMRVLHDAASTLRAERDALQARIDAALTWCDGTEDGYENDFERGYHRCAGRVRLALQPTPPADDGSCGASHYGKCGPKNLDCLRREIPLPADDGSEAEDDDNDAAKAAPWYCQCDSIDPCLCPDTAATADKPGCDCGICTHDEYSDMSDAQHRGYVHGYRDGRAAGLVSKEPATSVSSDAENESPPFKVGDWVRVPPGGVTQVTNVDRGIRDWAVRCDVETWFADDLEPWHPKPGERVTGKTYNGVDVTGYYTERPEQGSYTPRQCVDHDRVCERVHDSLLRPAQDGGEQ